LGKLRRIPFIVPAAIPPKNICWRFTDRFPYKVVYEILEADRVIVVAAIIHAARHDKRWIRRIDGV